MSDLTRRVLDVQKAHENLCKRTGLPLPVSMDDMETLATAAPTLARQVEAVEALADRLDAEAGRIGTSGGGATVRAFAAEIRTALNGETND